MASLTPTPKQQIYGSDGAPLVGGKIYTYSAGTTTPLATYTNSGGGTANTNPIILNSLGQADIWLASSSSYKFSVYTSADVLLYTVDNITAPLDYSSLVTALASPPPIGSTAANTGAFTTLTGTTGNITTINSTTGNITTINATAVTATTVTPTTLTFSGGGSMTRPPQAGIQSITATAAANALTVTLNPTTLDFRSSTLTSGAVVTRTVSSAISVVVSSGSTLGTVSAIQSRIVVLAIDNAGTVELAVVNIAGGNDLTETGLITTTAEGGAGGADSASTIYSTTARTSVAYRVVGYVESTQATAGTWATTPSTIQGCGGQALTAMSSLGYGQTWQLVTGSRALATTYYNTTGRPITVAISTTGSVASSSSSLSITVNSVAILTQGLIYGAGGISFGPSVTFIVPSGQSYSATVTQATLTIWAELR
jgi:hypothetical protein